jgi:KUP system potassium uptake protein
LPSSSHRDDPPEASGTLGASSAIVAPPVEIAHAHRRGGSTSSSKHVPVLHQQVMILSIVTDAVPEVPAEESIHLRSFGHGYWAVTAHYGFMQSANVCEILQRCRPLGLRVPEATASYYLGRETLVGAKGRGMSQWRKRLFAFLSRNAHPATDFFAIPANRVVEIGAQIEL